MRRHSGYFAVCTLACLVALRSSGAPSAEQPVAVTNGLSSEQIVAQLRSRLREAEVELGGVLAAESGVTNIPSGATPAEAIEYKLSLQSTVRAYERQLDDLAQIEALKQRRRDLAETIKSWTGFPEPPPYSILLVDNLRDTVHSLKVGIEATEATRDIFEKLGSPNVDVVHTYITGLTNEMGLDDFNSLIENLRDQTC